MLSRVFRNLFSRSFCTMTDAVKNLKNDNFVWIDLEMTGLDVKTDTILEIACIVTTPELNIVHDGIHLVVHQPDEVLNSMNEWCIENHAKTGLTEQSRKSKISLTEADKQVADYILRYTNSLGKRYIAGNSVYMDKIFLEKHMPTVDQLLHYRIIDVSSLKVLLNHWYPDDVSQLPPKKLEHRALSDILESIEELKTYRNNFLKK